MEQSKIMIMNRPVQRFETVTGPFWLPTDAPDDVIIRNILDGYVFEVQIVREAQKYIKPGTTVIDVGACYGQMTIEFSKSVGPEGEVIAVEASPFVAAVCEKNLTEHQVMNAPLINVAAWDKSGENVRLMDYDFSHFKSYGCFGVNPGAKTGVEVKTAAIDDFTFHSPVSLIKIDAQGADFKVLQGAVRTLKKYGCNVIYESEDKYDEKFGVKPNDFVELFNHVGYQRIGQVGEFNYVVGPR